MSRSLKEWTRQSNPPTTNGHAPLGKSCWCVAVNPYPVWIWWDAQRWIRLSRTLHFWWCPSDNSLKFRTCVNTSPKAKAFRFLTRFYIRRDVKISDELTLFSARTRTVSNRLRFPSFRSMSMSTFLTHAFARVWPTSIKEYHLFQRNSSPLANPRNCDGAPMTMDVSWWNKFKDRSVSVKEKPRQSCMTALRSSVSKIPIEFMKIHVNLENFENKQFNRSNFHMQFWSWCYRGCWHQASPSMVQVGSMNVAHSDVRM